MFAKMFETLFGCWHSHLSFPISAKPGVRRNSAASLTGTYIVCLDCGKEFAYDWREMKIVHPASRSKASVGDLATKEVG
jgi:predicted transcriptional regulator